MPPNTLVHPHSDQVDFGHDSWIQDIINDTPYIDIEVTSPELFEGAWKVVSFVFPSWKKDNLKFTQCKDGITNQLVRVTDTGSKESVLVRAYGKGSERIIDRRQEIINIITLSRQGLAPPLYARFRNGLIYGFIEGRVSHVDDLGHPKMAKWIATRLAQWHKVELPQPTEDHLHHKTKHQPDQKLWKTMRGWLDQVPDKYDDPKTQATFANRFDMKHIKTEMEELINHLEKLESPIVFSHNDLLYGNIIFDDDKEEAYFIDYEYGCYAYRGFDIGNHFNEHCGFECDYSKYPSKNFQLEWLEWYLQAINDDVTPTKEQINKLYNEVNGFSLASHFYWGLWAMIQAMVSDIDFDYMEYAVLRFDEYEKRKEQVLNYLSI
ncbi:kinase-like domain-containing protein [Halteromyces radiatus]|uniref:kinase-like domain-containing protein n=1 Tax=Halteromyces radiatus TaxID=101107 RepID=UPI0022206512|nr:kinase-like domain-containing protein [Halteromyces radiatus]KAI8099047.1 kinase-like domain-containing protein [Halteromyces radiatus]